MSPVIRRLLTVLLLFAADETVKLSNRLDDRKTLE